MALYAIGDLHLSLTADKSMEVFGPAWANYVDRIAEGLSILTEEDTLILAGDTSWGIDLAEAEADFRFLDQFPGKKYLIKGNHDYWWCTAAKLRRFFEEKGIRSLDILHNTCAIYGDHALCGTRGWFLEEDQKPHNAKVLSREVGRLENVFEGCAGASDLVLPPLSASLPGLPVPGDPGSAGSVPRGAVLLWTPAWSHHQAAHGGEAGETEFSLISADYLGFAPKKICV